MIALVLAFAAQQFTTAPDALRVYQSCVDDEVGRRVKSEKAGAGAIADEAMAACEGYRDAAHLYTVFAGSNAGPNRFRAYVRGNAFALARKLLTASPTGSTG